MSHDYERLSPDLILDAVESAGLHPDGHLLTLNSYENRVFQIGIDDDSPMVGKFYRPQRWPDAGIIEEHRFSLELANEEIPVIAPWQNNQGDTLFHFDGFRLALFPRRGGRAPELDDLDNLEWIGRFIGRIHLVGQSQPFSHRPVLDATEFGWRARDCVLQSPWLPSELANDYAAVSDQLVRSIEQLFEQQRPRQIRLHGDCHPGNILWTDRGPHFVDMDDCRMGPAIQDLWMLLNGDRQEMTLQLDALLEGYRMFRDFDITELTLIEPLRTLRLLHYTAWLTRRWEDPAFPLAFPWFADPSYWASHLNDLHQQILRLGEPSLSLY